MNNEKEEQRTPSDVLAALQLLALESQKKTNENEEVQPPQIVLRLASTSELARAELPQMEAGRTFAATPPDSHPNAGRGSNFCGLSAGTRQPKSLLLSSNNLVLVQHVVKFGSRDSELVERSDQ